MEKQMQKGWIKLYRQIQDNEIWTDGEPFDRRAAFIDLLLTANHTTKKIFFNGQQIEVDEGQRIISVRNLATRWKWSKSKVERYLDQLEKNGMIKRESDNKKTILTIQNYGKFQQKTRDTNEDANEDTERDTKRDTETSRKSSKNDNDRDTEQDTNRDTNRDTKRPQTRNKELKENNNILSAKARAEKIMDLYNETCKSLPQIAKLTETRIRSINARLKEYTEEEIAEAFRKVEASPFLRGDTGRWKASFDWIIKPANMQKILEGNYDDKQKMQRIGYDFGALQKFIDEN